ncbi:MAG: 3-hydroxyacyl-CoA dehydrogenase [Rhodoferax sp.]|nr:3-hydroxyacyl-CoA dehydrogenase [Rhodoferax sp.]
MSAHTQTVGAARAMAVVGGGTMGVGIVYVYAAAGWRVTVVEPDEGRARALGQTLADVAQAGAKRGKLTPDQVASVSHGVQRVASATELPAGLDLVVETVPERLALKQQVLAQIAARKPGIIATNTSALSVDQLAASVLEPSRFLGMHFFNPVWSLPMVELIRGQHTSAQTLALAREFAESTGKTTITVGDVPGFATSRLDLIASLEAMRMLQDGVASAEDIDRAMVIAYRHPIGPLRLSDIVGLDVRLDIARHLRVALGERYAPPRLLEEMVARGELGQKSGKGFFDWPAIPPASR